MRKARSAAAFSALSLMLLAGQAAPVLAVESPVFYNTTSTQTKGSLTITEPGQNLDYYAYQLFTGSWNGNPSNAFNAIKGGTENEGLSGLHFGEAEFGSAAGPLVNGKYTGEYLINAIKKYSTKHSNFAPDTTKATSVAQQVVDYLGKEGNEDLQTADFANYLNDYLKNLKDEEGNPVVGKTLGTENKETVDGKDIVKSVSFSNLSQGYYLVVSEPKNADEKNLAHTTAMLVPVNGAVSMKSKSSLPTVEKKVKDLTGDKAPGWKDTASVGLIDQDKDGNLTVNGVSYQLKGRIAKNIEDYETYLYRFVDTLPNGMVIEKDETVSSTEWESKLREDWQIKFRIDLVDKNNEEIVISTYEIPEASYPSLTVEASTEAERTGSVLKWEFTDLKTVLAAAKEAKKIDFASYENAPQVRVIIEYTPKYTAKQIEKIWKENQALAKPQENSVFVEFSNDPKTNGEGKTNKDVTKVYSFNLDLTKVDENTNKIDGAQFDLETQKLDKDGKPVKDNEGNTVYIPVGRVIEVKDEDENVIPGRFNFTGLDAGVTYRLTESVTPDGYKKIEPIEFWIEAIHAEDGKTVTDIKVHIVENKNGAFGLTGIKNDDKTFTFSASATAAANVVNTKGPNMPVTGQAGIWTGVAVGGLVLAVSAVAILKNKKEEA